MKPQRLQDFSQGITALYNDLGDRMRNVVIITMTEFGRTVRQNGSGGTDHGHASVAFALGGPVKGGKVYGKWPGLEKEQLFEGRDLAVTTDFRQVLSELREQRLLRHAGVKIHPSGEEFRKGAICIRCSALPCAGATGWVC